MDYLTFLKHVGTQTWAEETMGLYRDILKRTDCPFPGYLAEQIRAALLDESTRDWMTAQLLRYCVMHPRDAYGQIQMVDGTLFYSNRVTYVVHGTAVYLREIGWDIADDRPPVLVGGKPCWVELSRVTSEERVVWAGARGKAHPMCSVSGLTDAGGTPCYAVRSREGGKEDSVMFMAVGTS